MSNELKRKYGLFTAICMVVGIVIGSGVFFKAQDILKKTGGDMPLGIVAWIIGGAIMLVSLLTFSFMGQKYEKVNGLVDYADATVGSRYGYFMGWFVSTVYLPSMTAVLAWVSAMYTMVFLTSANPNFPMMISVADGGCAIGPECIALTLFYLCGIYAVNALSPKLAGRFQTGTTLIKMIPLVLIAVVGLIYGLVSSQGTLVENFTTKATHVKPVSNPLLSAVCATAFAYEGWIIATSINAEIKDSKKNLPRALLIGGIVIAATYILYYVGVAGGATNDQLIDLGAPVAFTNIFGGFFGNVLNLFVVISCLGTTNGLMLASSRGMYSLAARGKGPAPKTFSQLDAQTNMPNNSAIVSLLIIAGWFLYFICGVQLGWAGKYAFDASELPIITIYFMYLPMLIQWIRKEKDQTLVRRFIMPSLSICGALFMIYACIFSHGWGCLWYLIVFAVIMGIGALYQKNKQ